jgi:hypothetical protein
MAKRRRVRRQTPSDESPEKAATRGSGPTTQPPPGGPTSRPDKRRSLIRVGIIASLLAAHLIIAITSIRDKSPTHDEVYYLTRGYTFWRTGDFRMAPPHPPLSALWAALPPTATNAKLPPFD